MVESIRVTVRLFASLRDTFGAPELELSLPAGTPVGAIWGHLADREEIGPPPAGLRYAINDEWTIPGAPLRGGDRAAIVLPVSGG